MAFGLRGRGLGWPFPIFAEYGADVRFGFAGGEFGGASVEGGLVGAADREGDGGVGAEKGWVVEREGSCWEAKSVIEEGLVGGEVEVG